MYDDEVWDEDRWESFLRKDDERVTRYMKLLNRFMEEHPMPPSDAPDERDAWDEAFRAFLAQHGWIHEDAAHSGLIDDIDDGEAVDFDELEYIEDDELLEAEDSFEALQRLPVYQAAYELTGHVLKWTDRLPGSAKDSTLVQFCSSIMQITGNIAKGHGIGYERDMLGGNIACLKRGISAANAALELLREQKDRSYMDAETYQMLYEKTYEVRNQLGIYIQDLRDRFNLGID